MATITRKEDVLLIGIEAEPAAEFVTHDHSEENGACGPDYVTTRPAFVHLWGYKDFFIALEGDEAEQFFVAVREAEEKYRGETVRLPQE